MAVKSADLVRDLSERQLAMERQLGEVAGAVKALQARVAELSQPAAAATPAAGVNAAAKEVVTPEILVVITAAVTAYLGKKVRIRSAKLLQTPRDVVNSWSQQGRAIVQASHHPRIRS